MGEAYRTWIILYCTKALFACVALHVFSSIKMSNSDGQRTCAYQYMYTVHEVFIVHTHRCNLVLFTHEKCDNGV